MSENKLTVGELVYKISGDMDNLKTELKKADTEIKKIKDSMEKTGKTTNVTTTSFLKGAIAVDLFRKGIALVRGIISGMISEASKLTESVNAVNVVFGSGSQKILDFGKNAANSVGLARSEYNQMATITGALLKDTGLTMDEVADKTNTLTQRAADMASVFNTDVSDAMSAINQAVRGETEAIRRYAGDVTDASLQTYLFSQGINKNVTQLTEQEKRLYRVELIMKQTDVTAGDFANTSDSLANQQRILTSRIKNGAATIGTAFLPAIQNIGKAFIKTEGETKDNTKALDSFGRTVYRVSNIVIVLGATISNLGAVTKIAWNLVQEAFIGGAGIVLGVIRGVTNALGKDTSTIDTAIANLADQATTNLADIADAFDTMKENSETIKTALDQTFNPTNYKAIEDTASTVDNLSEATQGLSKDTEDTAKKVDEFQGKLLGLAKAAGEVKKELEGKLGTAFTEFGESLKGNFEESVSSLAQIVISAQDKIKELQQSIKDERNSLSDELSKVQPGDNAGQKKSDIEKESKERVKAMEDEIKKQKEILKSREDFEERQAERISAIRTKLEEAGIDATKAGLDSVLTVRSLEEQIEDERRLASLDEFQRFEEAQSRKLVLLTDGFITEATLLKEKISTQKDYEADLTNYLLSEESKRLAGTEDWAQATISKYAEVADSLQNLLTTQTQLKGMQGAISPISPSSVVQAPGGKQSQSSSSTTTNSTNISAPVTINGQNVNNLSAKEISAIMGFELNKFIR